MIKRLTITLICAALLFLPSAQADNVVVVNAATTVGNTTTFTNSWVFKNKPGDLISFDVFNSGGVTQYIFIMNAATLPADGAVEFLYPPTRILTLTTVSKTFTVPLHASKGIVICNSITATTKQIGAADCFFRGQIKP